MENILELLRQQVNLNSKKTALIFRDEEISYEDLNAYANHIAEVLSQNGVGKGDRIGIYMEQSHKAIISMVGVLKAGASYIPIDKENPIKRVEDIAEDSELRVLLTDKVDKAIKSKIKQINFEFMIKKNDEKNLPEDIYAIYTSGTTGKPKGVMINNDNLINYVKWFSKKADIKREDTSVLCSSFAFDLGYTSIFPALLNGSTVLILEKSDYLEPNKFFEKLNKNRATYIKLTPSLLKILMQSDRFINGELKDLRLIVSGGEAIDCSDIERVFLAYENIKIMNHYGPSETCIGACANLFTKVNFDKFSQEPNIGKAIDGMEISIMDGNRELLKGDIGEICISGLGVSKGYIKREELTEEKFVSIDGKRYYRTGDKGRKLEDGNIEFLGRIDEQVKIRGYRVEILEIENIVSQFQGVDAVAVRVENEKDLSLFYSSKSDLDEEKVESLIEENLPHYMMPSYIIKLANIPINLNGKTDKKSLPNVNKYLKDKKIEKIEDETEKKLSEYFFEILNYSDELGRESNFFRLGGNSLKAVLLKMTIHKNLNINLNIKDIFENKTIKELARLVKESKEERYQEIEKAPIKDYYPLSSAQKRMFILNQMNDRDSTYNITNVFKLDGKLDKNKLEEVFREIIKENESLRTGFKLIDSEPVQFVRDNFEFDLIKKDIEEKDIEKEIENFINPFDLGKDLLIRAVVFNYGENRYILAFDTHHIVSDGISTELILGELSQRYNGIKTDKKEKTYKDYVLWQSKKSSKKDEAFWVEKFGDELPILSIATDKKRAPVKSEKGDIASFQLRDELYEKAIKFCNENSITLYSFLFGVYGLLLHRYSGQDDIVIGTPSSGRDHNDIKDMIGMFVNTLAVRIKAKTDLSFIDYIQMVKDEIMEALNHESYQFDDLVEKLNIKRDMGRNPIFDTMFTFQDMKNSNLDLNGIDSRAYKVDDKTAKFDILFTVYSRKDSIDYSIQYSTDLYEKESMENLAGHFENVLESIFENPKESLGKLPMISKEEEDEILIDFNDTKAEYRGDKSIFELIEEQVEKQPDEIAVIFQNETLTYRELNEKSNQVARLLRKNGVGANRIVGVVMQRSLEMMIALLGIVKAGGAYLPMAPEYPKDRIAFMLDDSNADIVLTQERYVAELESTVKQKVIDLEDKKIYQGSGENLELINSSRDLAYIIYTSGSTGKPKGVMIEHRSLITRLAWQTKYYNLSQNDIILQKTPFTFDVSVWELFWALSEGAKLCFLKPDGEKDPYEIVKEIKRSKITVMHFVPSMLRGFLDYIKAMEIKDELKTLNQVFASGEALLLDQVDDFNKYINKHHGTNLTNLYGPTEATIDVSYFDCAPKDNMNTIPIGKPVDNTRLLIINRSNEIQPVGVAGELCILGDQLSRGYLNRDELTKEKFIDFRGERMYRTGDLAKWRKDGEIEYLGRIDHQIKIRGFRIELGEIEEKVKAVKEIEDAAVLARDDNGTDKYICAYYTAKEELNISDIKKELLKDLPEYMVPSFFVKIDKFPVTANGKLNRKALPAPDFTNIQQAEYVAPRDDKDKAIVEIWSKYLQVKTDIGIDDNFFNLGGHSLKVIAVIGEIHKNFNIKINMKDFFMAPTVRSIADLLDESEETEFTALEKLEKRESYDISNNQTNLWLYSQIERNSTTYNINRYIDINEKIETDIFYEALEKMIAKHESLRTLFNGDISNPQQIIRDSIENPFEIVDISYMAEGEKKNKLNKIVKDYSKKVYDIQDDNLFNIKLIRLEDEKYRLYMGMHHIISDGWSFDIFEKDLAKTYYSLKDGVYEDESLEIQYKDFAKWQIKNYESKSVKDRAFKYWEEFLKDGLEEVELPKDYLETGKEKSSSRVFSIVDKNLSSEIQRLAAKLNTTAFSMIFTAFNLMLWKLSGKEEILCGIPSAGRDHPDLNKIIGFFIKAVIMKTKVEEKLSFEEFLTKVNGEILESFEMQDYPLDRYIRENKLEMPKINVFFNMLNMSDVESDSEAKRFGKAENIDINRDTNYDLELYVEEKDFGMDFAWVYKNELFKEETVKYLADEFSKLLGLIVRDSKKALKDYDLFNYDNLEIKGNSVKVERDFIEFEEDEIEQSIAEKFEKTVERHSEKTAIIYKNEELSYRELNETVNRIANSIIAKEKLSRGTALLFEHGAQMIVAMLGALKSGNYYVPLDPTYPEKRLEFMLSDSGVKTILTNSINFDYAKKLSEAVSDDIEIINLDELNMNMNCENPVKKANPSDYAYILYTSGSTGLPKGVIQNQRNVLHFIMAYTNNLHINSDDRMTMLSSYSFDAAVMSIYGALLNGATLIPFNVKEEGNMPNMPQWIEDEKITIFHSVPTLYRYLMELIDEDKIYSRVRLVVMGGEAVFRKDVEMYKKHFEDSCIFINGLGPTESTVTLQNFINKETVFPKETVPVGFPVKNTEVYLLNEKNEEVPVFGVGEISYASNHIALGYLNQEEKTNEVFFTNPKTGKGRIYKTGDLGKRLSDGSIEFVGRKDFQIKIRGFRVELGEIESSIDEFKEISKSIVMALKNSNNENYLVAYYTEVKEADTERIKAKLKSDLPFYMVPEVFVKLDEFPLTPSGKIDRKSLPKPDLTKQSGNSAKQAKNLEEKKLIKIWKEVLNLSDVGVASTFFELGGHSLLILELLRKIKDGGADLTISDLYDNDTIEKQAKLIMDRGEVLDIEVDEDTHENQYVFDKFAMKIIDEITSNEDNFSPKEISCFYRPMGILHKSYNEEFYMSFIMNLYQYMIYARDGYFRKNMFETDKNPYESYRKFYNGILEDKFNLKLKEVEFGFEADFHSKIVDYLENGARILVSIDMFELPYDIAYRERHYGHHIIIKGYDKMKQIYYMMDNVHVDGGANNKYRDFVIRKNDIYHMTKSYYDNVYKDSEKYYFHVLESKENFNAKEYNYARVLKDLKIDLEYLNDSSADIQYLEKEFMDLIQKEIKDDQYKEIVLRTNYRSLYYNIMLRYLEKIDEDYSKVMKKKALEILKNWHEVRIEIFDKIAGTKIDEAMVYKKIAKNIELEKLYRENIISKLNSYDLENIEESLSSKESEFIEKNNLKAKIIHEDKGIKMLLSETKKYETWTFMENGPQVLVKESPKNDNFYFETKVKILEDSDDSMIFQNKGNHTGIVLKFDSGKKYLFGMLHSGENIGLYCPEEITDDKSVMVERRYGQESLHMRVEKNLEDIVFLIRDSEDSNWENLYSFKTDEGIDNLGMFARTWERIEHNVEFSGIDYKIGGNE